MKIPVKLTQRAARIGLTLFLICLGVLAVPSPIKTTTLQEVNDAASLDAKGLELYRARKFEEAIKSYQEAIKLKQDFAEAYYHLGDAYFQLAQYKKAIEAYKQAARYRPESPVVYNNIGTSYNKLGEYKKAIEAYKEAIRLSPKEPAAHLNLGATYLQRGNEAAALEEYKILKTIDPALAEQLHVIIYKPMALVSNSSTTRVRVIVEDAKGVPVADLGQEDFEVVEDGIAQTISSFSKEQNPLAYVLAVDNSQSVRPAIELVVEAAKTVVQTNLPNDETFLVRFVSSDKIETVLEFTSDKEALKKALDDDSYVEAGQSAILDAVYLSAQRVAQHKAENTHLRRVVVLLSDGDERSSYYKMEDLAKLLSKIDVKVFVISLGKQDKKGAKLNQNQPKRSIELLTKLASETGGQAFFPTSDEELQAMIKQMMNLIRTEYVIEYKPTHSVVSETFRQLRVNVASKPERVGWTTLTRTGYRVSVD
jgi:Ca-activated chloride channel family protein